MFDFDISIAGGDCCGDTVDTTYCTACICLEEEQGTVKPRFTLFSIPLSRKSGIP